MAQELVVFAYNILGQELAFGATPWVMVLPASILVFFFSVQFLINFAHALQRNIANYEEVVALLGKEYVKHWHKNLNIGLEFFHW